MKLETIAVHGGYSPGPATKAVATYEADVVDGDVWVVIA